jgi:signal transduction histidine kinase
MIYHNQNKAFSIYAFTIFIFSVVFLKAGYRHFLTLKSSIELKEEFEAKVKIEVEQNREKDEQILNQSRLAQMGEMISMIAHQWRQPITAISSTIININMKIDIGKFDLENKNDRELFFKFLDDKHNNIINYINSMSETIDDFRTFFKPDKTKELTSILTPIQRALSIVEIKMSLNNIDIIKNYQVDDIIEIYSNEMMQVILNILKNSEDNFEERTIKNPQIIINTKKDDKYYTIAISDNGGGISDDIISNIFDPYFTTKDSKNGTGLGLYMSKTMIEEHNNGLLCAKNIDNGVVFIIKIPI